jgi:threonine dehydrogenase-like Zn-dependent dehydrogenase
MEPTVETRVAHVKAAGELRFDREILVCEGLGGHELACETLYTAISPGTELAAWEGLQPLRTDRTHSRIVGYCNVARVISTGEWVHRYRPGDLVLSLQSHRSHFVCGEGDILLKLPDGVTDPDRLAAAATTYLFHQGYSALLRGDMKPAEYVGVLGLGTVGLAAVAVASRFGARVFGFSDLEWARELGTELGAVDVYDKRHLDDCLGSLRDATARTGLDIVVTTSGEWDDWRFALELCRPGGKICVLGFPGRREPIPPFNPMDPTLFYRKHLSLISCGYTPDVEVDPRVERHTVQRNVAYLLDLVLEGALPARRLISEVLPWFELGDVYARIAGREEGLLTAVLDWTVADPNVEAVAGRTAQGGVDA